MPFGFESRALLAVSISMTALAAGITIRRRTGLPRVSLVLGLIALILWSLAAGGMVWRRAARQEVTAMVDVSPSTRTAAYRQRVGLERRIRELIGDTPFHIVLFADGNREDSGTAVLEDVPAEQTVYSPPPAASAVLLFSDARFDLPASGPPTYPVIDPNLESPNDAAVRRLTMRGSEVVADVGNGGGPRKLMLRGAAVTQPVAIGRGMFSIAQPVARDSRQVAAELNAGDAWPENDALSIMTLPPMGAERWWVGGGAPAGWRGIEVSSLPQSSAEYLAPAVIMLNNVSADAISVSAQPRLGEYVRELGGALVILGGDHAYAAGNYLGTILEGLSPLASTPPEPARRWVVLVDGSGSMSATAGGGTQWDVAGKAVGQLMGVLPPKDAIAVGSFADHVTWWSNGKSVAETAAMRLPPTDVGPHGPTNLERALSDVTTGADGVMPTEFLIVTDAEARVDQIETLAKEMQTRKVRLHVLAIGNGSGVQILDRLATETGGSLTFALDAATWSGQLKQLGRDAMPRHLEMNGLDVTFRSPLRLAGHTVKPWNRTWMKEGAEVLAEAKAERPVARWQVGAGQVMAVAFSPTAEEAEEMAKLVARVPGDPRFKVSWDEGAKLAVHVDAVDGKTYLNDQQLSLVIEQQGQTTSRAIPQMGPGRYEISVEAPRSPAFAAVRNAERLLDRIAVAGRYAVEFDAIGNDHAAMYERASRTGGEVIDVRRMKPIDFRWPRRDVSLTSWLAAAGAVCFGAALGWWRIH
jgi:hypothetical protein